MNMFSSHVSPLAKDYVADVLKSGMLSEGEEVKMFEEEFEKTFSLKENSFVSVNSGTSALHLALEVLKVKGKVLLPANTFIATGLAVLYAGCTPVFCDILDDGTIDPNDVREKITHDTVAVICVNWAGKDCQFDSLEYVCDEFGLPLIVDAAQSLGRPFRGDITCLSFQATKHLTTGDGGGLVCRGKDYYADAKRLRWFGISKTTQSGPRGERLYNLNVVGYKYHMNNISAAIGRANLRDIGMVLRHHKLLASRYYEKLSSWRISSVHRTSASSFWAYPIRVDNVDRFSSFCKSKSVPCSIIHRGIDHNSIFGGVDYSLRNQRLWEQTTTHLPINSDLSLNDVDWICSQVNQYV